MESNRRKTPTMYTSEFKAGAVQMVVEEYRVAKGDLSKESKNIWQPEDVAELRAQGERVGKNRLARLQKEAG